MRLMLFVFVFCTTFVNVVCRSFFHAEHQFDIRIKIFRNGGNNTECDRNPVVMKVNTVIDDFAYFKARAGVKLGYIPEDCTEWSRSRPRRPFDQFCQPLTPNREPSPRCGYTSYTDRIRVYDNEGQQLDSLHFAKQGHEYFVVPPGDHFFWPGSYVGRKLTIPDIILPDGSPLVLETLSLSPRVFFIEKFVTMDECQKIIDAAEPRMHDSQGFERGKNVKIEARTSQQAWLSCNNHTNKFICDIDKRIAAVRLCLRTSFQRDSSFIELHSYV
mmetsp:Transcript_17221/g.29919  ORF Transcript_17221/g.29919 Transcript_17221/m.29919 type:complete len:272 (-) Transcript_17221:513-1328(-)